MVLRYILFFLFISLDTSFAATYTVSNVEEFRQALQQAKDGDTILVNPGTYNLESNQIINRDITIKGLGATPNSVRFSLPLVGQAVFNIYTREATIENLSIRSYEHAIEINDDGEDSRRVPLDIKFLKLDIRSSGYNKSAIEIKDAKSATVLIKDSKLSASIDTIFAEVAGALTVYNSEVEARQSTGVGAGGVISGAIHAIKVDQLNVLGGYIKGMPAGLVGTRAIEIGPHVGHTSIISACIHGGSVGVGMRGKREKKIRIERSTLQSYSTYGILYNTRNSRVEAEGSCLYGNIPVHDSQGSGAVRYHKNKHYHGNYWENPAGNLIVRGQRLDLAPINSCPPANNCIYTEPPQYEYDFIFDECKQTDGAVFENRLDGANGTANGKISQDPNGQVCRAVKFDKPRARIKIPNLSDTLNKTATMTFWIKTTQIGDKRLWRSPAITGIERRGGVNDIFWGWINNDGKIGISMGNFHKSISRTSINDGKWHHVALSREDGTSKYQVYVNGARERSGVFRTEGFVLRFVSPENRYDEIGGTTVMYKSGEIDLSEEHVRQFVGSLDELKIFKRILSTAEIQAIYNNEKAKKNHDGTSRDCLSCKMFDAWDIFRDINDRNISTKIVSEDFNLSVSSIDPVTDKIAPYKGTLCYKIVDNANQDITLWQKSYYSGESEKNIPHRALKASKNAHIFMRWKDEADVTCPIDPNDLQSTNEANSTDNFAIRPNSFEITAPTGEQVAKMPYVLEFFAKDALSANTRKYNEQNNKSFKVSIDESKMRQCASTPTSFSTDWSFDDGYKKVPITAYKEGNMSISISDTSLTCKDLFAGVDCKDKNITSYWNTSAGVPIGNATISMKWVCEDAYFDAWDTFRDVSSSPTNDRNISTKIVKKDFNITIGSTDENGVSFKDFNGTVCARVEDSIQALSSWKKLFFAKESKKIATFNTASANKDARIKLAWKKDKNLPCPLINEDNSTKSTDNFAIRPQSFNIIAPTTISSGEDFNITFQGLDGTSTNTSNYNETQGSSFEVKYKERSASCATGIFDVNLSSLWSFNNGAYKIENAYSEVGVVDINISDTLLTCNALFARVDCKDKNITNHWNTDTDVPIGKADTTISFTPHHFDINANLENIKGGTFTYLANLSGNALLEEMSAKLSLTIDAKNAKGDTTQNYSFACYAKPSKIDISYLHSPITPSGRLSAIIVHETNTSKNLNAPIGDTLTFEAMPRTIFDGGSASLGVRINFDRNYSKPVNPFDINISDINITDDGGVKEESEAIGGEANFLYGRAKADELFRQLKDGGGTSNNRAYVNYEIYDTTLRTKNLHWLQNSRHWYRNALHVGTLRASDYGRVSAAAASRVNKTVPTSEYDIRVVSVIGPFSASNPGISTISMISRGSDTEAFKNSIHLEVNPWLWHTDTFNPKPYSPVGSCSEHPCFDVNIFSGREAPYSIESGNISGSDINVSEIRSQDIRESGIKVFR